MIRCAVEIDSESLARRGSQNDVEESTGIGSFAVRPEGAESLWGNRRPEVEYHPMIRVKIVTVGVIRRRRCKSTCTHIHPGAVCDFQPHPCPLPSVIQYRCRGYSFSVSVCRLSRCAYRPLSGWIVAWCMAFPKNDGLVQCRRHFGVATLECNSAFRRPISFPYHG